MNDDKIRISPDALIAMIVTEAQDRELAQMPSLEEMNEDFQPSEKFQRKMEALVHDTKRKAERKKRLLDIKRFFITLTAAISIFSCTMLPVKAVREAVITTLIEWHDKFVSIIYDAKDGLYGMGDNLMYLWGYRPVLDDNEAVVYIDEDYVLYDANFYEFSNHIHQIFTDSFLANSDYSYKFHSSDYTEKPFYILLFFFICSSSETCLNVH